MIAIDAVRLIIPLSHKYILQNVYVLITEFKANKFTGYRNQRDFTICNENCKRTASVSSVIYLSKYEMMHNEVREIKVSIKLRITVVAIMKLMWALQYSTGWFSFAKLHLRNTHILILSQRNTSKCIKYFSHVSI
jgi:hypothetical protein